MAGEIFTKGPAIVGSIILHGGGAITSYPGVPPSGPTGFGAGIYPKGTLCLDVTDATLYENTNTKASPTWGLVGNIAGLTSTAAELNQLHSQGAVTTDFAKLHALTATAAEVNVLHSVTAGVARASSGVVLDAGLSVTGLRRPRLTKIADYPITAGDSGAFIITNPAGADITLTLPAPADGLTYKIMNIGTGSAVGLTIATNGAEKVNAKGITPGAGKGLINTFATEALGDAVDITSDGTDWFAILTGTWARVA